METLGDRIKSLRISKRLKQSQLAALVGLNPTAIHYYENGFRQPTLDTLVKLSRVFNVTTDYLLGCEKHSIIDASILTPSETAILRALIAEMSDKNRELKRDE